jgi:hypothetical protein
MCDGNGLLAVKAALEVITRLIEMLSNAGLISPDEVLELAEIAKRYERSC